MSGKPWTMKELLRLKGLRAGDVPAAEIAAELGRTRAQVYRACSRYGVAAPRRTTAEVRKVVAYGQRYGLTDGELARKFGLQTTVVRMARVRFGLPVVPDAVTPPDGRAGTKVRYVGERRASVEGGWPAVSKGKRRLLELMERLGPATVTALTVALDARREAVSRLIKPLRLKGYVTFEAVLVKGKTGTSRVYSLSQEVTARRQQWRALTGQVND